jgi:hypothetical protein
MAEPVVKKPIVVAPVSGTINTAVTYLESAALKAAYSSAFNSASYSPDTPEIISSIGTPQYGTVILGSLSGIATVPTKKIYKNSANDYKDALGNNGSYPTIVLDIALVTVKFNNQVIRTTIQGLPYTIKEYISGSDYDITITGTFSNPVNQAPLDFIAAMNDMLNAPVSIPVTNYFLNNFNIYYLVIMPGCSLPQLQGEYSNQTFSISAVSDVPVTTILP